MPPWRRRDESSALSALSARRPSPRDFIAMWAFEKDVPDGMRASCHRALLSHASPRVQRGRSPLARARARPPPVTARSYRRECAKTCDHPVTCAELRKRKPVRVRASSAGAMGLRVGVSAPLPPSRRGSRLGTRDGGRASTSASSRATYRRRSPRRPRDARAPGSGR